MAYILVIAMLMSTMWSEVMMAIKRDPFSNDINKCLFDNWPLNVLNGNVPCNGDTLAQCFSVSGTDPAQFAVCYNLETLIPDFTGHVLVPAKFVAQNAEVWRDVIGEYADPRKSSSHNNYKMVEQQGLYPNFDNGHSKRQYCAKGHLVPVADFPTPDERKMTYINTNIAPQWQLFNEGNWARVEEAVRDYADNKKHNLYIITGTAGFAKVLLNGKMVKVKLKDRVFAPRFYWKVVCDPQAPPPSGATTGGQSVLIMADNNIGDISDKEIESPWNPAKKQTKKFGYIQLYSLDKANKIFIMDNFHLPPLGKSCNPDKQGTFLNTFLDNRLQ